jgi:hypothetical protein
MTITDIVTNIDRRLDDVRAEVTHLERARAALVKEAEPAVAAARPHRSRRQPAPSAYQVVPVGKLTALLAGSAGMRTRELSHATHGDPAHILTLLKEQENAGQVRRTGTRAATRWHAVTDEDRIVARTAELDGQRRPKRARRN